MAMNRAFSFESHNGNNSHQPNGYQSNQQQQHLNPHPSNDLPEPISPVSSVHSRANSRFQPSFDLPRRQGPSPLYDEPLPPVPPPHRQQRPASGVTTGMDNFGERSQGGGLNHVAQNVADRNARASGMEAARGLPAAAAMGHYPSDRYYPTNNSPYMQGPQSRPAERGSYASNLPLAAGASTPGSATPYSHPSEVGSVRYSNPSLPDHNSYAMGPIDHHYDSPYHLSHRNESAIHGADILPQNIADDGDDGFMPEPKRKSMLPISRERSTERLGKSPAVGTAAVGAGAGALGGIFGRKPKNVSTSGSYNSVPADNAGAEKSEWLSRQTKGNNKMRWTVGIAIGAVVVLAIIGGVIGGVLGSKKSSNGGSGSSSSSNGDPNEDPDLNSGDIQALMNNKNLHKVFPAMDYTPWGTQYPDCMKWPPIQSNVTKDMAVLSQLTNTVRLYGTDCNQTEMVLHAIDKLELKDMKVWLGVWIDTNQTTTDRQIAQMYDILEKVPDRSIFKGAIVGNEALYRAGEDKAQSEAELIQILTDVKSNFTSLNYDLPVATSDLGDNWNAQLVQVVDYVMSNIHPFFAGVNIAEAAGWTWDFWQSHDVVLTQGNNNIKQVISETGWPSGGGTDCGNEDNICAAGDTGSVASVDNMNQFMEEWVCQALANGTDYFWFEAFDEPWKVSFNTPGKEWEDKWGLMDPGRNLKDGLKIPDCGGQTIS